MQAADGGSAGGIAAHSWPGNVRELANAIERAHVSALTDEIDLSALPPAIASPPVQNADLFEGELLLEAAERRLNFGGDEADPR